MNRRTTLAVLAALLSPAAIAADPGVGKTDLFRAGEGGYATYRIPGVVVTKAGTVLAYCEARRTTSGDWAPIDLLLRRGEEGGMRWSEPVRLGETPAGHAKNPVAVAQGLTKHDAVTFNNPVAIVDGDTVHFLYCVEYARCFHMASRDDGLTWSEPIEITSAFEELRPQYDWKVIATGPGHGVRLASGRLVVAVWLSTGTGGHAHRPSCVSTIYSDDAGRTWHAGEVVVNHPTLTNPSETVVAQRGDGSVLLNIRSESKERRRAVSVSRDGATGWSEVAFVDDLYEPVCMGSLIALGGDRLVYAGPDSRDKSGAGSRKRERLTVRLSRDGGATWPIARVLEEGIAGYSDLAAGPNGTLFCFYERSPGSGKEFAVERLTLTRFDADWLAGE